MWRMDSTYIIGRITINIVMKWLCIIPIAPAGKNSIAERMRWNSITLITATPLPLQAAQSMA